MTPIFYNRLDPCAVSLTNNFLNFAGKLCCRCGMWRSPSTRTSCNRKKVCSVDYLLSNKVLLARKSSVLPKTRKNPYPLVSVFISLGYLVYIPPRANPSFLLPYIKQTKWRAIFKTRYIKFNVRVKIYTTKLYNAGKVGQRGLRDFHVVQNENML